MNYALRSENSNTRIYLAPADLRGQELYQIDDESLPCLIWPGQNTAFESHSSQKLLARIEYLEQKLAEQEHLKTVRQATLASATSVLAAWDDDDE